MVSPGFSARDLAFPLPQRQREALGIVIEHVFYFHGSRPDVQNSIATIDDVAFTRNEYIFPLRKKNFLRLAGLIGEPKKLKVDWRWRRRLCRSWIRRRVRGTGRNWPWNRFGLSYENVPS